jgi:hypothetical protein
MANCAFAACHSRGGIFQSAVTFRSTSQMSLIADSSDGKCPRERTLRRTVLWLQWRRFEWN